VLAHTSVMWLKCPVELRTLSSVQSIFYPNASTLRSGILAVAYQSVVCLDSSAAQSSLFRLATADEFVG